MQFNKIIVLFLLLNYSLFLAAQTDTVNTPEQFVFPEFSLGIIRMANGDKVPLKLNYNLVTEKMVFMQKNQIFDLLTKSAVDTIYISNRRFIPFGKVFYEFLSGGPATLFIEHKGIVKKPARPAAYGGTTEVASSTYINNLKIGNQVFRMDTKGEIIIRNESVFWVREDNQMFPVSSSGQMLKVLQDKLYEMKVYIRSHKVDFADPDQVKGMVNYYNRLPR
jgi:hypothetical protein